AAKQSTGLQALFYAREARTMQAYETELLQSPIHTTIISKFDREALPVQPNNTRVVPNGVDTFFFQPLQGEKPYTLVFVGNLSYQPNLEAARFLCEVLMPKLVQRIPTANLLLAGANMPSFMKQWESTHIHCAGWMKDIRTAYASAQLFVAPLFSGAGVQNKMLEAMSMGMPCITTPLVNASLNAPVPNTVLTANDADGFVSHIEGLLKNREQAQALGKAGRKWVETHYRWTTANATLIEVIQHAMKK
ncbi:MAG: glycosyltransferase, partial [Chitinophagaceae bacterium]|nr:glycosyltransferase [Chitinophagaceae bacterium]